METHVENKKLVIERDRLDEVIEKIKNSTNRKAIKIDIAGEENVGLTESKFGGYPYWPSNMEYPVDCCGNNLVLLSQINLSDVKDERLPETGLLQFYIGCDDILGLDDDKGYKVVYHQNIDPSVTEESVKALGIRAASDLKQEPGEDEEFFPLSSCFSLKFTETTEHIFSCCALFDDLFFKTLKEVTGINAGDYYDEYYSMYSFLSGDDYDYVCEKLENTCGHKMFGYPFFTQYDPRKDGGYDILLFQMDTDFDKESDYVMWGDSGVGNFFICEEDLKALNFDKVLYNWDCC